MIKDVPMKLSPFRLETLEQQMDEIKRGSNSPIVTNYFKQPLTGRLILGTHSECTALFINDDMDFYRLYFYSSDLVELAELLRRTDFPASVVSSYIAKELDPRVEGAFQDAGFTDHAVFVRLVNYELRVYEKNSRLQFAEPNDLKPLWYLLMEFDRYTDYFPKQAALLDLIKKRQVILNRKNGTIKGYIIFRVMGSKVNFNYFYNRSDDPRDSLMLLHNFYAILHERGIKSGVQWNNLKNVRVRELHRQFGWKEEATKAFFYLKEKETVDSSIE